MAVSTQNTNYLINAASEIYLAAYGSSISGASYTLKVDNAFSKFFTAGGTRQTPLTSQWAVVDENGLTVSVKGNAVEFQPNFGSKRIIGYSGFDISCSGTLVDLDAAKWAELANVGSTDIQTIAAATGVAGRTTVGIGGAVRPTYYTMLVRTPSGNGLNGATSTLGFDNYLFLKGTFNLEAEAQLAGSKILSAKFTFNATSDSSLLSPYSNQPLTALFDTITASAT